MDRITTYSGIIRSVGHDPITNTLEIEFASGNVWQYTDVTEKEYKAMMQSSSLGSHFHENILGKKHQKKIQ